MLYILARLAKDNVSVCRHLTSDVKCSHILVYVNLLNHHAKPMLTVIGFRRFSFKLLADNSTPSQEGFCYYCLLFLYCKSK